MVEFRGEIMGFQPGQRYVFKNFMPNIILRTEPKERSNATGRLAAGREVVVVDSRRNWVQVQQAQPDGTLGPLTGWMLERSLKRMRPLI